MNKKLGITSDVVKTNKYSDYASLFRTMSEAEKNYGIRIIEMIYDDFVTAVADGRNMTKESVDNIGKGRIWSGSDAVEIGLVDVIGGLSDAIEIAAEKAGVDKYTIVEFPKLDEPIEK